MLEQISGLSKPPELPCGFYVYAHLRQSDGSAFYIGKGQRSRAWWRHSRSEWWNHIALKHGVDVHIVAANLTEDEALNFEKVVIAGLRDSGVDIINLTDGGDGVSGYRHDEQSIAKIKKAVNNPDVAAKRKAKWTKTFSDPAVREKHRAAIAASYKWRDRTATVTPEANAKRSASTKAFFAANPDKVALATAALRRAWADPEKRAKRVESVRKALNSEEYKQKSSTRMNEKWGDPEYRAKQEQSGLFRYGSEHHAYDRTLYKFHHAVHGERVCTQFDLRKEFALDAANLSMVINGKRKSHKGWSFFGVAS